MNFGKIIQGAVVIAAPVVAGVVAGPEAAGLVALGLGAGGGTKKLGKLVEEYTGWPVHQVAAPVAAVAAPALAGQLISPEASEAIGRVVASACDNHSLMAAIPGLIAIFFYGAGKNIRKSAGKTAR